MAVELKMESRTFSVFSHEFWIKGDHMCRMIKVYKLSFTEMYGTFIRKLPNSRARTKDEAIIAMVITY